MSLFSRASVNDLAIETWLPGETLFGLASRHHIVSCNCSWKDTCRQLFGPGHTGLRHDFPTGVDFFVKQTDAKFGVAETIILERTLLPFYLPLNSSTHAENAIRAMRGERIGSLRYSMGMLLDHFRVSHPLKACEVCMNEDIGRFGVAYWHRIHQIPGVWCCPHHQCSLMLSSNTGALKGHYGCCLPRIEGLTGLGSSPFSPVESRKVDVLGRFANAASRFTALAPHILLDGELLAHVYSDRLVSMGLRKTNGKLCLSDCVASVLTSSAPLRAIAELSALPATNDGARAYVSRLCWRPIVRMHPLLHLFTIVWLFGDWEAFWRAVELRGRDPSPPTSEGSREDPNALYRQRLADIMADESRR